VKDNTRHCAVSLQHCGFPVIFFEITTLCVHQAPRPARLQVRILRVLRLHLHGHS